MRVIGVVAVAALVVLATAERERFEITDEDLSLLAVEESFSLAAVLRRPNLYSDLAATGALADVSVDPSSGNVLVAEAGGTDVRMIDPSTDVQYSFSSGAGISRLHSAAWSTGGDVFVEDIPSPGTWDVHTCSFDYDGLQMNCAPVANPPTAINVTETVDQIATRGADLWYSTRSAVTPPTPAGEAIVYDQRVWKHGEATPRAYGKFVSAVADLCVSSSSSLMVMSTGELVFMNLTGESAQRPVIISEDSRNCVVLPNDDYLVSSAEGVTVRGQDGSRKDYFRAFDIFDISFRQISVDGSSDEPEGELTMYRRNVRDVVRARYNVKNDGADTLALVLGLAGAAAVIGAIGTAIALKKKPSSPKYNPETDDSGYAD